MVAAGRIAGRLGLWSLEQETRQKLLIEKAGLPIAIPTRINLLNIIDSLKSDKKVKAGIARFILPHKIGQAFISEEVTSELILSSL
jgi:3-dehydroquinate synthase